MENPEDGMSKIPAQNEDKGKGDSEIEKLTKRKPDDQISKIPVTSEKTDTTKAESQNVDDGKEIIEIGKFNKEVLDAHNKFRAVHAAPPLKYSAEMSRRAEAYANKLANLDFLKHSSRAERQGHGENLYYACSTQGTVTGQNPVSAWYNEVCSPGYNFEEEKMRTAAGHFTQVVWRGTTELGIGRANATREDMRCTYVVARYKEAGNLGGTYKENVQKGSFDRDSYCKKKE